MGKITILEETTKYPITLIGKRAGICWGGDIEDDEKNYKRGINCLKSNHGRVFEYVNIEMIIEGYSARVIREWYTHIGGSPTRLQASTRYIDYTKDNGFKYVIPNAIKNNKIALAKYKEVMSILNDTCKYFEQECNIKREDSSMILPLAMETTIVDKRNLRNLIDMSKQRLCTRAYWEYRQLFYDIMNELNKVSNEWEYIVKCYLKPKCEYYGYCIESKPCKNIK